jgi:hypothetical protein
MRSTHRGNATVFDTHRDPEAASAAIEAYQCPWASVSTVAASTTQLRGVRPEVARRAGHGVAVLLKIYAHCIDG